MADNTLTIDTSQFYLDFTGIAGDTTVTTPGIGVGFDIGSMISQIMDIKQHKLLDPLVNEIVDLTQRIQAYTDIQTKITKLYSIADDLRYVGNLTALTGVSSDENILTADVGNNAIEGSYVLNITQLAQNEKLIAYAVEDSLAITNPFADDIILDSTGSLTITVSELDPAGNVLSSTAKDIKIDLSQVHTLYDLVTQINNQAGNYLEADYIYDGSQYRLSITAKDGYGLDISDAATVFSSNGYQDLDPIPAKFTLTGLVLNKTTGEMQYVTNLNLEANSNNPKEFEDSNGNIYAIPDVTLHFKSVGQATLEIKPNIENVKNKLQNFVDTYNDLMKTIYEYTYFKSKDDKGLLFGDTFLTQIKNELQNIISTPINGLTLANIGIYISDPLNHPEQAVKDSNTGAYISGTLYFDKDKFEEIFSKDPKTVVSFLAGSSDGSIDGVMDKIANYTFDLNLPGGPLYWELTSSQDKIIDLQKRINSYKLLLWNEFTAMYMKFAQLDGYVAQMQSLQSSLASALARLG